MRVLMGFIGIRLRKWPKYYREAGLAGNRENRHVHRVQLAPGKLVLGSDHFIIWGGGLEELFSADYFFT